MRSKNVLDVLLRVAPADEVVRKNGVVKTRHAHGPAVTECARAPLVFEAPRAPQSRSVDECRVSHDVVALHLIVRGEIALRVGSDLTIGRMVDSLNPDDARLERLVVHVSVANELKLGGGRTHDQDALRGSKRARHRVEEVTQVVRMVTLGGRTFGMAMEVMVGSFDGAFPSVRSGWM